jgi:hypothetical protein
MFHGDGRASENPQDFLKQVEISFANNPKMAEVEKVQRLYLHCKSACDAEEWYEALTGADKADWATLVARFQQRWPKRTTVKKTDQQRKEELFGEVLMEGRLLEKEERGGLFVYGYVAWADRVQTLANALGDTTGLLVSVVRDGLPEPLKDLVEPSHASWGAFADAVRAVSPTSLRTSIEKEQRLRRLESYRPAATVHPPSPQSPTSAIRRAFSHNTTLSTPLSTPSPQHSVQRFVPATTGVDTTQADLFASGGEHRTRLFAYQPPATPTPTRTVTYRDPRVRLIDLQRNALPHHPDTETGRAAYQQQVIGYTRKYGTSKPDEFRPYPLLPGTEPLSSGACFGCGTNVPTKHFAANCPLKKLPGELPFLERTMRAIGAVCYGLIRGPLAPTLTPSAVAPVRGVDVSSVDSATLLDLINGGAYVTEVFDQEKEDGLSA